MESPYARRYVAGWRRRYGLPIERCALSLDRRRNATSTMSILPSLQCSSAAVGVRNELIGVGLLHTSVHGETCGPCSASWESRMDKPRIFLGSSGKQAKLLQAITRGLEDVAYVEP